jgi:hypothetical protein
MSTPDFTAIETNCARTFWSILDRINEALVAE